MAVGPIGFLLCGKAFIYPSRGRALQVEIRKRREQILNGGFRLDVLSRPPRPSRTSQSVRSPSNREDRARAGRRPKERRAENPSDQDTPPQVDAGSPLRKTVAPKKRLKDSARFPGDVYAAALWRSRCFSFFTGSRCGVVGLLPASSSA